MNNKHSLKIGDPFWAYAHRQKDAYQTGYFAWRRMLKVLATAERLAY
jgi:hypothetical protein